MDVGPARGCRPPIQTTDLTDQDRCPFAFDDAGFHNIPNRHSWHDKGYCDADVLDPINSEMAIDDGQIARRL